MALKRDGRESEHSFLIGSSVEPELLVAEPNHCFAQRNLIRIFYPN
jgi:hypothetical protein